MTTFVAYKTADTSRTSTSTYTDDPHLSVTASTSGRVMITACLIIDGSGTGNVDFRFRFSATSASGSFVLLTNEEDTSTSFAVGMYNPAASTFGNAFLEVEPFENSSGVEQDTAVIIVGEYNLSFASPATVTLQWAQSNSSSAWTAILKQYSWIKVTEL